MGLIEQAAKRLEELRRAGVEVPEVAQAPERVTPLPAPPAQSAAPAPAPRPRMAAAPAPAPRTSPRCEIDLARLAGNGFVTPDSPRSRIAEEFRILKRPLLANAFGQGAARVKNGNLIMVTSAIPGEGKTFTAVNLAMSMAMELDRTVLLVDADIARPSIPKVLELPEERGMLDVLGNDSLGLGDVMMRTNVEKLSFLSSGNLHPRAAEMLASDVMTGFLDELSTRYSDRIVIFDSPPLLVTTESRVLANRVGQIVFVVRAESTSQSEVKRALATIEDCPVKLMVLNAARSRAQGAYGYGYGETY